MQSIKEQSLIVSAIRILTEKKEPVEFYTLFGIVCDEKDYSKDERANLITRFYSDITTSAKFVYTGDNHWDLKEHQKTELWEKDGSFFKEYTEIKASDYADNNLEAPKPKPKKVKAKKAKKAKKVVEVKEEIKEEVIEIVAEKAVEVVAEKAVEKVAVKVVEKAVKATKEEVMEKVVEAAIEAPEIVKEKIAGEDGFVEYEEEVTEEFEDDFDEDKYNEYMDTYEDQYKD